MADFAGVYMDHYREIRQVKGLEVRPIPNLKEEYPMLQTRDAKGLWMQSVLAADTLTGDRVLNRKKEDLGTIEHLMIDVENGRVAYAVLSFGGFLDYRSLITYTIRTSSILYFQRNTTGAALISSKYW